MTITLNVGVIKILSRHMTTFPLIKILLIFHDFHMNCTQTNMLYFDQEQRNSCQGIFKDPMIQRIYMQYACLQSHVRPFIDPVAKNFVTVSEIDLDFIDVLRRSAFIRKV